MYSCSECGTEFEVKPDFCDCGNDVFIEIEQKIEIKEEKNTATEPKKKKTFEEQYPVLNKFIQSLDPISVIIFVACILLSIASLVFIKPTQKVISNTNTTNTQQKEIPDVESFWDDTPPKPEIKEVKTPVIVQTKQEQKQETKVEPKVATSTSQPVQKTQNQKPKQSVFNKISKTAQQNSKNTKQTTNTKTQSVNTKSTQPTTQKQPTTSTKNTAASQKVQQQQQQPVAQNQTAQKIQQPTIKPINTNQTINAQEFKNYKNNLRSTIFSKINLLNVYGDGHCEVVFSINPNGKLTNRSFSIQSSNETLNDEVYNAIMATPTYNPPPAAYQGQKLHFSVTLTNGRYSVSLY